MKIFCPVLLGTVPLKGHCSFFPEDLPFLWRLKKKITDQLKGLSCFKRLSNDFQNEGFQNFSSVLDTYISYKVRESFIEIVTLFNTCTFQIDFVKFYSHM